VLGQAVIKSAGSSIYLVFDSILARSKGVITLASRAIVDKIDSDAAQ
jgi:hypothetical protein